MLKKLLGLLLLTFGFQVVQGQLLMDMLDTTTQVGKGLLDIYRKYDRLRVGGYIQPEFQVAGAKGAKSFEGGDFPATVDNRFMLRRGRLRIDYIHLTDQNQPGIQIVFQMEANERALSVRDMWGRVFENKLKLFSFTAGIFARPVGYEVNLGSNDRESPERGRMSQTLMKSERDIGAMVSFDVRRPKHLLKKIKIDLGIFNGQGITATGDFDNKKDIAGRMSLKPTHLSEKTTLTAGASVLYGGLLQNTKYMYSTADVNGNKAVVLDSSVNNAGRYSPRSYKGIDVQLKIKNKVGFTELRGEYLFGEQTGTAVTSETPTALLAGFDGFRKRHFNGAYFYFVQHLASLKHQLVIKYDWYDPNTKAKGKQIDAANNFTAADIKYNTLNIGYLYHISDIAKLSLFYAIVKNEFTAIDGFTTDTKDNVFTCRLQFRF